MGVYVVTRMERGRPPKHSRPSQLTLHIAPARPYHGATKLLSSLNWHNCEDGQVNTHCKSLGRAPTRCKCRRGAGEPCSCLVVPRSALELTDSQTENALQEHKQQAKLIFRRITSNSEPRCSIESGQYTLQYVSRAALVTCALPDVY